MKFKLLAVTAISLTAISACNKNNILVLSMEASFFEQFSSICIEDQSCITVVETYGEDCFDKSMAIKAMEANTKSAKRDINTLHITKYQKCITANSPIDYWADINMVDHIFSQL